VVEYRDLSDLRIGAKLPHTGPLPQTLGIPAMARALEQAGFDSLWVADHVVLPASIGSSYPFAADGRATWATDTPYIEALVALAMAGSVTERVHLGTAVIVLPQRNPVLFAKQVASIAAQIGERRITLGVGAGWLAEEFAALNAPFAGRGARTEEWIGLLRDCWTGRPAAHATEHYTLPEGILMLPPAPHPIAVLMGGHAPAALARGGRVADGWLGQQNHGELDPSEIEAAIARMREVAAEHGRDGAALQVVLRIIGAAGRFDELAADLPALVAAGVGEIIVDASWDGDDLAAQCAVLRGEAT
jgi:probable F420-dependent oxidoreductase